MGHAKCYSQLGLVEYEKFKEARAAKLPDDQLLAHLNAAAKLYHQALENDPPDNPEDLAIDHNQLGNIYHDAGDLEGALEHYNESIRYKEMAGNIYSAGTTRFNIAITLANNGRPSDALLYARAALRNFEPYGQGAAQNIQDAQGLIAEIEQAMKGK
jgi:tetratricopeptide (TPR) repeat protein